jgi:hypothetical protein
VPPISPRSAPLVALFFLGCSSRLEPSSSAASTFPTPAHRDPFGFTVAGIPAPSSAPASAPAPAAPPPEPPPPPDPGRADLDPQNDTTVAPPDVIADCDDRLAAAGIRTKPAALPVRHAKGGFECGAPQVVVYRGPKDGVRWSSSPLVTCGMALALARFETILQEEAQRYFEKRVARIEHVGTYNCREMVNYDWVSEHSYANAIDVTAFQLSNGKRISIERDFGRPANEPKNAEGRFLRALARRLYDDEVFSVVVTEFLDPLHRTHFHFDMARYRADGTR